jgi:hypothetical protein
MVVGSAAESRYEAGQYQDAHDYDFDGSEPKLCLSECIDVKDLVYQFSWADQIGRRQ